MTLKSTGRWRPRKEFIATQGARLACAAFGATALIVSMSGFAAGENYPIRPITLLVSTTAGASPDLIARLFAHQLSDGLKMPVIVENRGGANGQIAVQAIADSAADGYTLLATTGATLAINPALYPRSAQLVFTKLAPVTQLAHQDFVITVSPSLKVHSLAELIAWSKEHPDKLNVATTAVGSIAYLTAQLFKQATGIDFVMVPHNGGGQAITAVLGNNAHALVETITLSRPYIDSGKLIPIAVTGPARSAFLSGIPTLTELGTDVRTSGWTGIVAPKATPTEIIGRVQHELSRAVQNPALKAKLDELSAEPVVNLPGVFGREWREEAQAWGKVIKTIGMNAQNTSSW
jgi:tripartite-type tricarboxylate transporter receptor subunit TctC